VAAPLVLRLVLLPLHHRRRNQIAQIWILTWSMLLSKNNLPKSRKSQKNYLRVHLELPRPRTRMASRLRIRERAMGTVYQYGTQSGWDRRMSASR